MPPENCVVRDSPREKRAGGACFESSFYKGAQRDLMHFLWSWSTHTSCVVFRPMDLKEASELFFFLILNQEPAEMALWLKAFAAL